MNNILKPIYRSLNKLIPNNNYGDKVIAIINFIKFHRRFPSSRPLFNDYLYKIRHSNEAYNPLRAYISDKEWVKDYVSSKIGKKYNVPTIKILRSLEEATSFEFPVRCCIKPTHLSGEVILRQDGEDLDFNLISEWFASNHYALGREKNYRYLTPKVIVEPLIFDKVNNEDIKLFCYKGKAKFVQIDIGRRVNHTRLYFDRSWKKLEFSILKPVSTEEYQRPKNYMQLLEVADALSSDLEFIRVDLYTDGQHIYVGELTNWPENGNGYFVPRSAEEIASKVLFFE
jgi:hypothetical protein